MKMGCVTDEKLIDLLDGELPADEARGINEHLAECVTCRMKSHEYDISMSATMAVLEAEGKGAQGPSIVQSVMDGIYGQKSKTSWRRTIIAAAALIALICAVAVEINFKPRNQYAETLTIQPGTASSLTVDVEPNSLSVKDSIGGVVRQVAVRP